MRVNQRTFDKGGSERLYMSADINQPEARPMTDAFNALFVGVSRSMAGGHEKVCLMQNQLDAASQLELTTTAAPTTDNRFSLYQPYTLQQLVEEGSQVVSELASVLLELHRDRCPHTVTFDSGETYPNTRHDTGVCWGCGRIPAEMTPCEGCEKPMPLDREFSSWCCAECAEPKHIDEVAQFTDADCFTDEIVECSDCLGDATLWVEDTSTRVDGHCGCWADCEECDTVTGANCQCDNEAGDSQNSDILAKYEQDQAAHIVYNGRDENKADRPVFYDDENGEFQHDNEFFKSHVLNTMKLTGLKVASLVIGWETIDCAACGDSLDLNYEGDGIEVNCELCAVGCVL